LAITRLILLASFKALGAIRALVLTGGLAALTAVAASFLMRLVTGGGRQAWVTPVQVFALEIAGAFLIAALGMAIFMPRISEATRVDSRPRRPPPVVPALLAVLAIAAIAQMPSLAAWWAEDRALLAGVVPSSDPSGLNLIPAVVLFSLPAVAALALVTFVLTSVVGLLGRAELAFGVLTGCLCLQAGLVVGEQFLLNGMAALGATVLDAIAKSPDATASAQVTDWLARHDAAASGLSRRLIWILGGYTLTAAVGGLLTRRGAAAAPQHKADAARVSASADLSVEPSMPTAPLAGSTAAPAFPRLSYSIRPRQNFVDFFLRRYSTYDITTIPRSASSRFSFDRTTGVMRREPGGPTVLRVTRGDRHGVFAGRDHVVADGATGALIGTLRPAGSDYEIADASGAARARVVEKKSGVGHIGYVAIVDGQPVCRFTWAMQGLSVLSAGLDVEFLTPDPPFDRALAIAIAPVLEHKARRASEWRR
jgi:hypothetical protein